MDEIDVPTIKKRSVSGVIALTSRTFFLQIVSFGATFLLTILLSPAVFGIFFVVSAVISFLSYFSDIGLAAALVQKKETLTREDLSTTFTIQQALVIPLSFCIFLLAPFIGSFYALDEQGIQLLRALVIAFFLSSLKTIPSILLERKLDFTKLVIPQILETVIFYCVAVFFAWKGYGITSFSLAVLARACIGLCTMYIVSPWRITFGLSKPVAKKLLTFGLPFQLNSFLALLKDDLLTIFLGKVLTFSEVGYIGWAKKWSEVPLRLIMDSVIRVTFPTFSRLQHSKKLLTQAIEKILFGLACAIFPISVGLLFFIEPLITFIPRYAKWEPALPSFYFFVIAAIIASFSTPLTNALNAVGRIRITLSLMIFWTTATWILTIIGIALFGFHGVAIALLILSISIIVVVALAKRIAPFSMMNSIRYPVVCALIQSIWYAIFHGQTFSAIVPFFLVAVSGGILYCIFLWIFEKQRIDEILAIYRQR